jgi:hypothetical protein
VVHAGLGEHGIVLDLGLAHGRAVVADDDQLSCDGGGVWEGSKQVAASRLGLVVIPHGTNMLTWLRQSMVPGITRGLALVMPVKSHQNQLLPVVLQSTQ